METKDIRRLNLAKLLEQSQDSRAEFAKKVDLQYSQVSQILSGHRNLGDKLARQIEEKAGKEKGWMDIPQNIDTTDSDSFDIAYCRPQMLEKALGPENTPPQAVVKKSIPIRVSWLAKEGLTLNDILPVRAYDVSMEPTILMGDELIIKTKIFQESREILPSGKIFALIYGRELLIRRIKQDPIENTLVMWADHADTNRFPAETIPLYNEEGDPLELVEILGPVIWRSGPLS